MVAPRWRQWKAEEWNEEAKVGTGALAGPWSLATPAMDSV
jgi:hypothetical protein